jgi:hypothetical protein
MEADRESSSYYSSIPKKEVGSNADSNLYPIVQGLKSNDGDHKYQLTYNDDPEPERPPTKSKDGISQKSETLGSDVDIKVSQPGQKNLLFVSKS